MSRPALARGEPIEGSQVPIFEPHRAPSGDSIPPSVVVMTTTVASLEEARQLAHEAVAQGLAACVQIEPITSVYVWDGAVQESVEQRLSFKTLASTVGALRAWLLTAHPYELPQVLVMPAEASPAYAAWVAQSVKTAGPAKTPGR